MNKEIARQLVGADRPVKDIIWDTKMWHALAASATGELANRLKKSISRTRSALQSFTGKAVVLPSLGYTGKLVDIKATDEIRTFTIQAATDSPLKSFLEDPREVVSNDIDRIVAAIDRYEKEAVSALLEGCAQASRQMIRAQDVSFEHEVWEGYPERRWHGQKYAFIGDPWELRIHKEFEMHDDPTLFKKQRMGFFGWAVISIHSTQPQNVWAIVE